MAVGLVGSAEKVRMRMGSSEADYAAYCTAAREPSSQELSNLVTLIIDEQAKVVRHNRELIRRVRDRLEPGQEDPESS